VHYAIKQPELKYKQLSKALQTHMEAVRLIAGIIQTAISLQPQQKCGDDETMSNEL
jgi:hypothetical protein